MELPLYKMVMTDEQDGVHILSLVDSPAIMVDWVKFSESKSKTQFKIQDEERRIIFGPALIPDLPIYRRDELGREYYVTIDKPTIEQVAIKFSQQKNINNFDINHNEVLLSGVTLFEIVVTDKSRFPVAVGFEDLPEGTMFATAKVNNDAVWQKIKSGEVKGFSITGLFKNVPTKPIDTSEIGRAHV